MAGEQLLAATQGNDMKRYLMRLWLRFEYACHKVDQYLASHRGDQVFATDCYLRALDVQRQIQWMEMQ